MTERFKISGFGNINYRKTDIEQSFDGHAHSSGINEDGSFEGTRLALNVRVKIDEKTELLSQFMAEYHDGYQTELDWGFINYQINSAFTARAGLIKFPVGLINEYIDVGYSYSWITPPPVIYSEKGPHAQMSAGGPQATRESFTGGSLYYESLLFDEWLIDAEIFGGEVGLEEMTVKGMTGITLGASYQDWLQLQISHYSGTMYPSDHDSMMGMLMEGKKHQARLLSLLVDWKNIVIFAEHAKVIMDIDVPSPEMPMYVMGNEMAEAKSSYVSVAYRIGGFVPFITQQHLKKGRNFLTDDQDILSAGLSYELSLNIKIKAEYSKINTEIGDGLFNDNPSDKSVDMFGLSLDFIF
ncbi:MAG: hypothetical protein HRU20_08725 [Pseudomonadales bacterium]|nr:hypothetical protein [Pseudomonadales bacterium]